MQILAGDTKGGPFDVSCDVAQKLLRCPNPDGLVPCLETFDRKSTVGGET